MDRNLSESSSCLRACSGAHSFTADMPTAREVQALSTPPPIRRVLETALYVDDLERASAFYHEVLGLRALSSGERLNALDAGGGTVLLLFLRGATASGFGASGEGIPPHDGSGPVHFAFAVDTEQLPLWREHLVFRGIEIESELEWARGGRSLYFRDPDDHLVELASPGVWEVY